MYGEYTFHDGVYSTTVHLLDGKLSLDTKVGTYTVEDEVIKITFENGMESQFYYEWNAGKLTLKDGAGGVLEKQ